MACVCLRITNINSQISPIYLVSAPSLPLPLAYSKPTILWSSTPTIQPISQAPTLNVAYIWQMSPEPSVALLRAFGFPIVSDRDVDTKMAGRSTIRKWQVMCDNGGKKDIPATRHISTSISTCSSFEPHKLNEADPTPDTHTHSHSHARHHPPPSHIACTLHTLLHACDAAMH